MNDVNREIVARLIRTFSMPPIGITLTQKEADGIKDHIVLHCLEENIQKAVDCRFVR